MIIDLIQSRKHGDFLSYTPSSFYNAVRGYGEIGDEITLAMDEGTENDVKRELCTYIVSNGYNQEFCNYINSVDWLN